MPAHPNSDIAALFNRDPATDAVAVADGYGLHLKVQRGHLVIEDGIGSHRRTRRYSRAQRNLRRVVILGHTGFLTLDAIRWCTDLGVAIVHIDNDGRLLTIHADPGIDDPRLRRAQAAAASQPVGLHIARELLHEKLKGQADNAGLIGAARSGAVIRKLADNLAEAADLATARDLEAKASNVYFGAWAATVTCRFAQRDHDRVPEHWHSFTARKSPLHRGGRSPRNAADPANALLNYSYALAEAECRIACLAVGLDPGLGIVHTDKRNRDSLALDLLEVIRPDAERHVLRLLTKRHFRGDDFHETRQGACRALAPLTHNLAEQLPAYAKRVAAIAEATAHKLARSSPSSISLRTPLSRANTTRSQLRGQRSGNRQPERELQVTATCRTCGDALTHPGRQLCPTCWPVTRRQLANDRTAAGNAALAEMRAQGLDPSNTPAAAGQRSANLSKRKREEQAWTPGPDDADWTAERYRADVLPRLATIPLSQLQEATGLSTSACSRIRSGQLTPHRRHWPQLRATTTPRS